MFAVPSLSSEAVHSIATHQSVIPGHWFRTKKK